MLKPGATDTEKERRQPVKLTATTPKSKPIGCISCAPNRGVGGSKIDGPLIYRPGQYLHLFAERIQDERPTVESP